MSISYVEQVQSDMWVHMSDGTTQVCRNSNNGYWWAGEQGSDPQNPTYPGKITITSEMIETAVNTAGSSPSAMVGTADAIAQSFNAAIERTMPDVLSSKARAACLVGECAQETDWFKTTEEYDHSGPYAPYWGRGFIQLTHQSNYAAFGQWTVENGLASDPGWAVNNPNSVADLQWAPYTALFYFTRNSWAGKNLWQWCDAVQSPWYEISAAINYGNPLDGFVGPSYALRGKVIDAVLAVTPDAAGGSSDGANTRALEWIKGHQGAFAYSQAGGRLDPSATGYTDCSGLMYYAYQLYGVKIGTWTGDQQNYGKIVRDLSHAPFDDSGLQAGDLVFYGWYGGNTTTFDHVDMWMGEGRNVIGHGGPGNGPHIYTVDSQLAWAPGTVYRVRRYV